MIPDLVEKVHTSEKFRKAVSMYLAERDDAYMKSKCFTRLKKRYEWLRASLNGQFSPNKAEGYAGNTFLPSLIFPIVREMYYMVRAMTMKNFRQDPLITLEPMYDTPYENSVLMQVALNTNFKRTKFRSKCFERVIDDVSRCGLGVSYSSIFQTTKNTLQTVDTPFGPQQMPVGGQGRTNVVNTRIHPLDYAQDPDVVDPEDSSWKRIIESVPVSSLMAMYQQNPDYFVKEMIEKVLNAARKEVIESCDKYKDDQTLGPDFARHGIDVKHYYSKLWIAGNEDDETEYIIDKVEDDVISIRENTYDDSICPIQTYRLRRRPEYFWGNTPAEDNLGHEKFMHIFMNMNAQNAMQQLERYIFYDKNAFDISAVENARMNGGFVPVEMKGDFQIQNMIHEYQSRDTSLSNADWVTREVKESIQKSAFKPDFLRSGAKGGVANNTATAAQILDETSNILEADCMEVFGFDVCGLGNINTKFLQMFLGDYVSLRLDPKQSPETFMKAQLLGDHDFNVVSAIQKNRIQEAIRLQNAITQVMNYKGTADPSWANFNLAPMVKMWIRQLDIGDPDQYIPQMQQPMVQPQAMMQAPPPSPSPMEAAQQYA